MTKKKNKVRYNMPEIKIAVAGFTKSEIEGGMSYLLEEFRSRPWILNPLVHWDDRTKKLIISVGYDLEESDIEGVAMDEIWDCVIATINFQDKISFEILRA